MNGERRAEYAEILAPYAREFVFGYEDMNVTITRYTNHHRTLPDNGWCVCIVGTRYLATNGEWEYKRGNTFASPELALSYLFKHGTPNRAKHLEENGPSEAVLEAEYRV
jgi:hypothetical protein